MSKAERRTERGLKVDGAEAEARVSVARMDPKIRAWLRRVENLKKSQPPGTRIYYQEDTLNLMVLSPEGHAYIHEGEGEETRAIIGSVVFPRSDCGGW